MSSYDTAAWADRYTATRQGVAGDVHNIVEAFERVVDGGADMPLIRYFDGVVTARELDELSTGFAAGLVAEGFSPGDRAVVYMQNIPQFLVAQLGIWKAGGVVVSANPMYRERELAEILTDSAPTALVTLETLYRDVAAQVVPSSSARLVFTTSELDFQTTSTGVLADVDRLACPDVRDLGQFIRDSAGHVCPRSRLAPDAIAVLTYTSGTTGPPKGAMISHRNLLFNAVTYRDWVGIGAGDVIFGVAPLFHVTGIVGHAALAMLTGAPLVLTCRFEASAAVAAIAEHRATFTVGSITVFIALMNAPNVTRSALRSLTKIYSGGAPIAPSTAQAFTNAFGHRIHNIYGLTETTSPAIAVPYGLLAPVDEKSGAASVGVPVHDTVVRVVDESGADLPVGESGELTIEGPQVVSGYWHNPDATLEAMSAGAFRTGDVGFMNDDGWFFIVDRKKDQINASGFKVWPREVEDVLYEHPAVREVAVVGVPDAYRGETVRAFVSVREAAQATEQDLIGFAKNRLAAYKVPRSIVLVDDLPKTASGKILRRQLRETSSN